MTRRTRAQQSLSVAPPRAEEVHLIHNLYLQSIKQNHVQGDVNTHDQQLLTMLLNGENLSHKHGDSDNTPSGEKSFCSHVFLYSWIIQPTRELKLSFLLLTP